jgi:hypothetical protein
MEIFMSSVMDKYGTTRLGRIKISMSAIRADLDLSGKILSIGVPIHVVFHPEQDTMEYLLVSNKFDELSEDEHIPTYLATIFDDGTVKYDRATFSKKVKEETKDEIMKLMVQNAVDFKDFKKYMKSCSPQANDKDFETYDETFLEALRIYIHRRDQDAV